MNTIPRLALRTAPGTAARTGPGRSQRGAVLIVSLIILAVMLLSTVALVRSFDTSLTTAGNLALKRDLAAESERAAEIVLARFRDGGDLAGRLARAASIPAINYSAVLLPSNPQGIPLALLAPDLPEAVGLDAPTEDPDSRITIRYVVDRMCSDVGNDIDLGAARCIQAGATDGGPLKDTVAMKKDAAQSSGVAAGGAGAGLTGAVAQPVVYRLTVRATGPRGMLSFYQSTFSCCGN